MYVEKYFYFEIFRKKIFCKMMFIIVQILQKKINLELIKHIKIFKNL